jgi:hypothetical protein
MTADMYSQNFKTRRVNPSLTQMIIWLHEHGYTEDFATVNPGGKLMIAHNEKGELPTASFQLFIISQFFDHLSGKFVYLHAVETNCGRRGIVLSNVVLFANDEQGVIAERAHKSMAPSRRPVFAYQVAI